MENGFVEMIAIKTTKNIKFGTIFTFVLGLITTAFAFWIYDPSSENAAINLVFWSIAPFIYFLVSIILFFQLRKKEKGLKDYSILRLFSDEYDKKTVAKIINTEIAEGKKQLEYDNPIKFILLPTFFLVFNRQINVVPVEQLYWVYKKRADSNIMINNNVRSVKGFVVMLIFAKEMYYISAKNEVQADDIVAQFNKYIPNVLGEYDASIEKMFSKNHDEFLKKYNELKNQK